MTRFELEYVCGDIRYSYGETNVPMTEDHYEALKEIASKYDKSVAQLALRWELQHGIVVIPKSVNEERILENLDIFDFEIEQSDMDIIDNMAPVGASGHGPDQI